MHLLLLLLSPPPQVALHAPHSPQGDSEESSSPGQGSMLQGSDLASSPQGGPPCRAGEAMVLVSLRRPPPQDREQGARGAQGPATHATGAGGAGAPGGQATLELGCFYGF